MNYGDGLGPLRLILGALEELALAFLCRNSDALFNLKLYRLQYSNVLASGQILWRGARWSVHPSGWKFQTLIFASGQILWRGARWSVHPSGWNFQTFNFSSLKVFNCRVCLVCISLISSNFAIFRQLERFNWLQRSQERLLDARNANKGTVNRDHCFCKWCWIVERFLEFCIYTLVLPMSVDDNCTWFLFSKFSSRE